MSETHEIRIELNDGSRKLIFAAHGEIKEGTPVIWVHVGYAAITAFGFTPEACEAAEKVLRRAREELSSLCAREKTKERS